MSEIAPGVDLQRNVLDQAATPLGLRDKLRVMDKKLFQESSIGLDLLSGAKA